MNTGKAAGLFLGFVALAALAASGANMFTNEPGFGAADFQERRLRLQAGAPDGILVLGNAGSPDVFYLTGAASREAKLIIVPEELGRKADPALAAATTLFLPPRNPRWGVWSDPQLSPGEEASRATGIGRTAELKDFYATLLRLAPVAATVYYCQRPPGGTPSDLPPDVVETMRRLLPSSTFKNLTPLFDGQRWVKTGREVEVMKKACDLTAEAFQEAARVAKPGLYEYEVEGLISYIFRKNGASGADFLIIGSGPNSCILHHMSNDRRMNAGELLLIDIGVDYHSMNSDLTRTIPVSGKFSPEQRKIYSIVLEAQKRAIAVVKPGATLADVHKAAFSYIDQAGYGKYFFHGASHSLNGGSGFGAAEPPAAGLPGGQQRMGYYAAATNPLRPGTMFTVEPGIYIPEKNLGVRIEDDILVTETGYEVLTKAAPKEITDIEQLMSTKPKVVSGK